MTNRDPYPAVLEDIGGGVIELFDYDIFESSLVIFI